jgi:aarF domain-containing kinase
VLFIACIHVWEVCRDLPKELRLNYAKLWRAIIFGDEAAIRKYSARMNAGNMYKLWASMLTTKSFNKIVDQPGKLDKLRVTGSADLNATKRHVQQYHAEIGDVLRTVPRELLLILKTNDCLRNVDMSLGAPANNFIISARYIQRALNAERYESHPSLFSYMANAYDTVALELRLWLAQWYFSSSSSKRNQKMLT